MFHRSYHSIETETDGRSLMVPLVVVGLLCGWGAWFLAVPVSIYETTNVSRLEVVCGAHSVEAMVAGRILRTPALVLGRGVQTNEVIVQFDSEAQELAVAEERARVESLTAQIETVTHEKQMEERTLKAEQQRTTFAIAEVRGRHHEAVVSDQLAHNEAHRMSRLLERGAAAQAEADRAFAEAERRQAAESALAAEVQRSQSDSTVREQERHTRIAALQSDLTRLLGELTTEQRKLATAVYEVEQRKIRASAAGSLSEIANIHVGSVLKAGDHIATVLAGGDLRLVAELPPTSVFGHVRPGQSARVRFEGFPWVEYGVVTASVVSVAREARDGRARVELAVDASTAQRVPMEHGLSATVAIETERVTPAQLVLRAVGKRMAPTLERSR